MAAPTSQLTKQPDDLLRMMASYLPPSGMAQMSATARNLQPASRRELLPLQQLYFGEIFPLTTDVGSNSALLTAFQLKVPDLTAEEQAAWRAALESLKTGPPPELTKEQRNELQRYRLGYQVQFEKEMEAVVPLTVPERRIRFFLRSDPGAGVPPPSYNRHAPGYYRPALGYANFLTCLQLFVLDPDRSNRTLPRARGYRTNAEVALLRYTGFKIDERKRPTDPRNYLLFLLTRLAEYKENPQLAAYSCAPNRLDNHHSDFNLGLYPEAIQVLSMTGFNFAPELSAYRQWFRVYNQWPASIPNDRIYLSQPLKYISRAMMYADRRDEQVTNLFYLSLTLILDRLLVQGQLAVAIGKTEGNALEDFFEAVTDRPTLASYPEQQLVKDVAAHLEEIAPGVDSSWAIIAATPLQDPEEGRREWEQKYGKDDQFE